MFEIADLAETFKANPANEDNAKTNKIAAIVDITEYLRNARRGRRE
jgi:hypothetical protein